MVSPTVRRACTAFVMLTLVAAPALAQAVFRSSIDGTELDLSQAKEGEQTAAVQEFLRSGSNLYLHDKAAIAKGSELFLTACSGCHGHEAEGKIGPALRDDYWTYPKNKTDKGFFETMFGGARAMMGPMYKQLSVDEMLMVISWIRSIYSGDPAEADWLTPAERKALESRRPAAAGQKG